MHPPQNARCGTDPLTGCYRDGCCSTGPEDLGLHTICAVVTAEFCRAECLIVPASTRLADVQLVKQYESLDGLPQGTDKVG